MQDILATASDVVTALAVCFGAYVAWLGVSAWQRELQGRTEYDLARRTLIAVYRVRDSIASVRAAGMTIGEYADRPERKTGPPVADSEDLAYAFENRLKPLREAQSALDLELREAEAVWGGLLKQPRDALRTLVKELVRTIGLYVYKRYADSPAEKVKMQAIVWRMDTTETPDVFGASVDRVVADFDEELKRFLRSA